MKFSYKLFKKISPEIKSKQWLMDKLTNTSFEAEDLGGDIIDISVLPNRFSDAGSHWGILRDVWATEGKKIKNLSSLSTELRIKKAGEIEVEIKDKKSCLRYMGTVMEIDKNESSPKWMAEILEDCGMRPINAIVDIMNYAMLMTGQPMHAFDFDKLAGGEKKKIIIMKSKKGEKMETLDNQKVDFDGETLVIADEDDPIAVAGIKGGKRAEVDGGTKKIVIEAANFNQVDIFKGAKKVNIQTDASLRFAHGLSAELVEWGMSEAVRLIKEILKGEVKGGEDVYLKKEKTKIVKFDLDKFRSLTGIKEINLEQAVKSLELLGLIIKNKKGDKFEVEVPVWRKDIEIFADLAEEIARLYGINKIKPEPPIIPIFPVKENEEYVLREKVRHILAGVGLDEIYSYSFVGEGVSPELLNPISSGRKYLRENLSDLLVESVGDNLRFMERVRIFEIGRVFSWEKGKIKEKNSLAGAMGSRKDSMFFELKGVVQSLLEKLGLTDFDFREKSEGLDIVSGKEILGRMKEVRAKKAEMALFEVDFDKLIELVEGEKEYEEIVKYPTIMRDISFLVEKEVRIGEILRVIQGVDFQEIRDVDLVDFYEDDKLGDGMKSLTLRIVLQSSKKSLTDKEADEILEKIIKKIESEFGAEVR